MNERIKDLAELAGFGTNDINSGDLSLIIKQFAESLVKECVDICNTTKGSGYFNGEKAGRKIKEHFGIEE